MTPDPTTLINLFFAALTLCLPLGLMLLLASSLPEKDAPDGAVTLLLSWATALLAYFAVGFAFQFGGIAQVTPHPDLHGLYWEWYPVPDSMSLEQARAWGMIALQGWFLTGSANTPGALQLFLSHSALVGLATMLPVAGLIHRQIMAGDDTVSSPKTPNRLAYIIMALFIGSIFYPIPGNWLWGGGWLSQLGVSLNFGQGMVDFGGASLIFLTGSLITLTGLFSYPVSPQLFPSDASDASDEVEPLSPPMPSAYLPILSLLGAGLMLMGWFGLSVGVHTPTAVNISPAQVAVNGVLGAFSTMLMVALYSWFTTTQLNPLMVGRGFVAGLVLTMAGAPFLSPWTVLLSGLLLGLLLPPTIYLFEHRLMLTDTSGVIATFGLSSLLGLLLIPLLANGQAGQGWNSLDLSATSPAVTGLLAGGVWLGQLQAQLLGIVAIGLSIILLSVLLWQVIAKIWV
ncbi:hypothetical protein QUF64_16560 [Anaerolineales bacterium HSG6]|nr:hypothetical protein [Anaerolineales bacterium HSG6]